MMEGVLTPFLLDKAPPLTTLQTTSPTSGPLLMVVSNTVIRNLPSSNNKVSPIVTIIVVVQVTTDDGHDEGKGSTDRAK